jgi:ATP-dependent HslUV protease ATP-binding subunit HslU
MALSLKEKGYSMIDGFTPSEIVEELDKYIVGQTEAKRCVAIALRNRARRNLLTGTLRDEVCPKNIIMIGPTGVGKTEIARRLAALAGAPFLKVEATKFTEVGYVGRDVEMMIRDLTNLSVNMIKKEEIAKVQNRARELADERILGILLPTSRGGRKRKGDELGEEGGERFKNTREKLRRRLLAGELDERLIEIEVKEAFLPMIEVFSTAGIEGLDLDFSDALSSIFPSKIKRKRVSVREARRILAQEEAEKLIDMEKVSREAVRRVEEMGIIFLDEIDKITSVDRGGAGPDVSREGVQRDILPIIEGSAVNTKHGIVHTNHILFIAAGTFHKSKPSDLIPELQGRFPIRVELSSLDAECFKKILTQPRNALTKQYVALLKTEGVELKFKKDAIETIARIAYEVNQKTEDIGARRLHTIMEKVMEDLSFNAPAYRGRKVVIDARYVEERLNKITRSEDLSRFIL